MLVLIGLLMVLAAVFFLPLLVKPIEHNLEVFFFLMGLITVTISGEWSLVFLIEVFKNPFLYLISFAVLTAGILFKIFQHKVEYLVIFVLKHLSIEWTVFIIIVLLGLLSSVITAIIASLILVELIQSFPVSRREKIIINILACFSIGLGAVLTPLGEPLSTIIVTKMGADFWFLFRLIGEYVIVGIILLGGLGAILVNKKIHKVVPFLKSIERDTREEAREERRKETYPEVFVKALKVFLFVLALEFLGAGFKPLINQYIIHLDTRILYWLNMISAVVDNATLAAAEVSNQMTSGQLKAIVLGLIISGGMLIPGNIPNIITAERLKIQSREWAKWGVPLGLIIMAVGFILIF